MNDKEKCSAINLPYFTPFLRSLDESTFRTEIYPEIEFMMKRNASLVPVIGETLASLTFTFTPELVTLATTHLFTDEYMTKEDLIQVLKTYFSKLASKLRSKEAFNVLIQDFLLKRFIQTRNTGLNANQRMAFIRSLSSVLQATSNKELIDQDVIRNVLNAAIEFFFL